MSSNFGLTLVLGTFARALAALDVACFLVVADVERALDDEADYLRREAAGEFRCEGRSEGVEVVALVGAEAARRDNFPEIRVVGFREGGPEFGGTQKGGAARRRTGKRRCLSFSIAQSRGVSPSLSLAFALPHYLQKEPSIRRWLGPG